MVSGLTVFVCSVLYCSLSGGADDSHGNQTQLESAFNDANATWEISRYSGVQHGFTIWDGSAYNLNADARSWESMATAFNDKMIMPEKKSGDDEPSAGAMSLAGRRSPVPLPLCCPCNNLSDSILIYLWQYSSCDVTVSRGSRRLVHILIKLSSSLF